MMMINKRLIGTVPESKRYVAGNVALQWCSLLANIAMMTAITRLLAALYLNAADGAMPTETGLTALCAVVIRFFCTTGVPGWAISPPARSSGRCARPSMKAPAPRRVV